MDVQYLQYHRWHDEIRRHYKTDLPHLHMDEWMEGDVCTVWMSCVLQGLAGQRDD
jgi:hypothetical protein